MKRLIFLSLALLVGAGASADEAKVTAAGNVAGVVAKAPARVGDTRVAQWQGDKKAAFLLMFDDGWPSHWQVALPELKKRGMIGTFYVVPNKGEYKKFEKTWLTEMLAAGMVLGNHTLTHDGFQGAEDSEKEITQCTEYLLKNVPGKNPRLVSFALPGVKDYDYGGMDLKTLLAKNNLVDRPTFDRHGATYHLKTTDEFLAMADKAIQSGGMEYLVFHGLERIVPDWKYQDFWAVKQDVFLPFLDGLQARRERGDLWITDHVSQHQYATERGSAKVTMLENSAKLIRLQLKCEADPQFYDFPLTLITQVPPAWGKCEVMQGKSKVVMEAKDGAVQYEAVPGAGVVVIVPVG